MPTKSEHSPKVLDVVVDNLKDTLLAFDRSCNAPDPRVSAVGAALLDLKKGE